MLLGNTPKRHRNFVYRTLTVYGRPSQAVQLSRCFITLRWTGRSSRMLPQPRTRNACRLSHAHGLGSSAFAHHYSRNHNCFLFLRVLRCFTSPRSPPTPIHSALGDTTSLVPGFPIRKSPDHSLVADSPRHIAGSHVLHRLLMPRHPPYALKHLNTRNDHTNHTAEPQPPQEGRSSTRDARVHCAVLKKQPRPPDHTTRPGGAGPGPAIQRPRTPTVPVPSGPNSVSTGTLTRHPRSHSPDTSPGRY